MSKKSNAKAAAAEAVVKEARNKPFRIKYPLIWLALSALVVYGASFNLGFTELDDSIFIRDLHEYNEHLSNLLVSFHRGVFDATKDAYYRPLFLDSIIINYLFSEQNAIGYHMVNVLFHLLSVLLLFGLFKKLQVKELHAFILALLFAVHPVLSQAVAWIPGRNDTMLAIFTFSFLICSISYSNDGKAKWLLLSALALLAALFTKETAIFAAPVAFIMLVYILRKPAFEKRQLVQFGLWISLFAVWYITRANATITTTKITAGQMSSDFIGNLPLIIQYTGKIFLPFNLSVFPIIQDTTYYYGIAAIVLLMTIIFLAKEKDSRAIAGGIIIFLLFLLPALIVPKALNEQAFEHRLYLPIIGILLVLPQTVLFRNKLKDSNLFAMYLLVAAVLGYASYNHQMLFSDPITFWSSAAETSPNSAYANMMLGARQPDTASANPLIRKAYSLNPKEKYINFYMASMLQTAGDMAGSEKYIEAERKVSGFIECDFLMTRLEYERKNIKAAIFYMERYLSKNPKNEQANNNLLMLYMDAGIKTKALAQIQRMKDMGLLVAESAIARVNSLP